MAQFELTRLAAWLARPEEATVQDIMAGWRDQSVRVLLRADRPVETPSLDHAALVVANHVRRRFFPALAAGASPAAQANAPCTWDPPCALDVFRREQLRTSRGIGLPKPMVVFVRLDGSFIQVTLRVFGVAIDWFPAAAEALVAGLRTVPWRERFHMPPPKIVDRDIETMQGLEQVPPQRRVTLLFESPADIGGKVDHRSIGRSLLGRLLLRVDGLSRWQGYMLPEAYTRHITTSLDHLHFDESHLVRESYLSENAKSQSRVDPVVAGRLTLEGDVAPILPILQIGTRTLIGRGAREGLGRYNLEV